VRVLASVCCSVLDFLSPTGALVFRFVSCPVKNLLTESCVLLRFPAFHCRAGLDFCFEFSAPLSFSICCCPKLVLLCPRWFFLKPAHALRIRHRLNFTACRPHPVFLWSLPPPGLRFIPPDFGWVPFSAGSSYCPVARLDSGAAATAALRCQVIFVRHRVLTVSLASSSSSARVRQVFWFWFPQLCVSY
jgi:hypothetical protein